MVRLMSEERLRDVLSEDFELVLIEDREIETDLGGCWRNRAVPQTDSRAEIAAWILDADPDDGETYTASTGITYRALRISD